jgi:hypothetical protein
MRCLATLLPTITLLGLLAACGEGGEMGEPAGGSAMASGEGEEPSCFIQGASFEEAQHRISPMRRVSISFEGGEGLLCYGSPSARDREIMGDLVPYGQPWRMGADEPTTIHLRAPASVGSVELEPGSYSLYAVPGEDEWEIFVNTDWQRWGIPINAEVRDSEIGSFTVTPEATDSFVESLTYAFADGEIVMEWENTRLSFPVEGAGGA